ncbi:recombinase RecT [Streptococcus uberis]|uniref:recombinase RecT n=1 Tax=Streptococcus uberis TaxID=1349 RepID=UPI00193A4CA2|nr:recombinase RecT [Streptococcus uberis]
MTNEVSKFDSIPTQQAFNSPVVIEKFKSVLNGRETQFIASLLSIVNNNSYLAQATNSSIMNAAMKAATLNLPIEPSLGQAYVVPYNRSEKRGNGWVKINEAQFQIGYKGLIQLAQRSGKIKTINCDIVYEEEFLAYDKVTGTLHLSENQCDSGKVKGYFASFELINGFHKMIYWSYDKVLNHAKKYSKTYDQKKGEFKAGTPWSNEFDAMALKTLLKELLLKYAPLSVEMQDAILADNGDSTVEEIKIAKDVTPESSNESLVSDLLGNQPEEKELPKADPETGELLDNKEFEETELDLDYGNINAK